MTMRLEPIAGALLPALAELHRLCFPEDPWDVRTLAEVLTLPGSFGWLACDGGEAVGFVLGLQVASECEILSLGVAPQRRRVGTGLRLLDAVGTEARRRSAERLVLEVAVDNQAAQALYRRCGFDRVGRRAGYYRHAPQPVDALVLALSLSPAPPST